MQCNNKEKTYLSSLQGFEYLNEMTPLYMYAIFWVSQVVKKCQGVVIGSNCLLKLFKTVIFLHELDLLAKFSCLKIHENLPNLSLYCVCVRLCHLLFFLSPIFCVCLQGLG